MSNIEFETRGGTALIRLNRPARRNAIDMATGRELLSVVRRFEQDDKLLVAVLSGRGDSFCAGADLKALEGDVDWDPERGHGPLGPTWASPAKPVIAAVEGHAVAGGLELALWCDLRVAARNAVFGVFCRRWGVPLIDGGTLRLPRLIGHSRAMDMILTGRAVSAEEGLAFGLVNRLCEAGQAEATALELAEAITRNPQACMLADRRSAIEQWGMSEAEALRNEIRHGWDYIEGGDMGGGLARFNRGEGRHGEGT